MYASSHLPKAASPVDHPTKNPNMRNCTVVFNSKLLNLPIGLYPSVPQGYNLHLSRPHTSPAPPRACLLGHSKSLPHIAHGQSALWAISLPGLMVTLESLAAVKANKMNAIIPDVVSSVVNVGIVPALHSSRQSPQARILLFLFTHNKPLKAYPWGTSYNSASCPLPLTGEQSAATDIH